MTICWDSLDFVLNVLQVFAGVTVSNPGCSSLQFTVVQLHARYSIQGSCPICQ